MKENKQTKFDQQKKLDIIFNIPGFVEFVRDALGNSKLKLSDYMYLGDCESSKEDEIYLKRIS